MIHMMREEDLIAPNSRWFSPHWHRPGRLGKWHRLPEGSAPDATTAVCGYSQWYKSMGAEYATGRGLAARGRTRGAICSRCLHSRKV